MSIQNLIADFRYGARGLRNNPLFTLAALGTLTVSIGASGTGDSVLVRLQETGLNTGEFTGWVQTSSVADPCMLEGQEGGTLTASYTDPIDPTDSANDTAPIQPLSLVFDTSTGAAISGAVIRLGA